MYLYSKKMMFLYDAVVLKIHLQTDWESIYILFPCSAY